MVWAAASNITDRYSKKRKKKKKAVGGEGKSIRGNFTRPVD